MKRKEIDGDREWIYKRDRDKAIKNVEWISEWVYVNMLVNEITWCWYCEWIRESIDWYWMIVVVVVIIIDCYDDEVNVIVMIMKIIIIIMMMMMMMSDMNE